MIVFYNLKDGRIVGYFEGRIHADAAHKMHIGTPEENGKIVVEWKLTKIVKNKRGEIKRRDFSPNHPQADLFTNFDENGSDIYNYMVDLKTLQLVPKDTENAVG